ncbi:hypothetical protein L249_8004, partial [Ophiocordyceps polyrhachis-furcata BCC 54312]
MATISVPSPDHRHLLDMIDEFRARAIDRYVALPELIIAGHDCRGKGAILEAITGIAGLATDGRCPRFATELMLRKSTPPHNRVKASILPDRDRTEEEQHQLRLFPRAVEGPYRDLTDAINAARNAMGLTENAIGKDVLRVELTDPELPDLTVIDLPCLSPPGDVEQGANQGGADQGADPVDDMVLGYMNRKRSIILAVVPAQRNFSLPRVISLARKADPDRFRTLGIITEPSKVENGSEGEKSYVKLAQNRNVELRLDWHVLDCEVGDDFFLQSPWTDMDPLHLGIKHLKSRLVDLLKDHVLRELPSLAQDVSDGIDGSNERLEKLSSPRGTVHDKRSYLLKISQSFFQLTRAAIDGVYGDDFFGTSRTDEGYRRRLRAVVQNTLTDFASKMHAEGRSRRIVDRAEGDERELLRSDYVEEVRQLLHRNRGCELAGTFNPLIVGELFAEQCQPWRAITMALKDEMVAAARKTTQAVPYHVAAEETAEKLSEVVNSGIDGLSLELDAAVKQVLATYLDIHPVTYNGDLLDAVRKLQADRRRRELDARVRQEFGRSALETGDDFSISGDKLLDLLTGQSGTDEALSASSLAVDYAEAYYTISIKRFIDAISTRAIECELIQKLPSVLSPEKVLLLHQDEVTRLAADSKAIITERARNEEKLAALKPTLLTLRRLDGVRPTGSRGGSVVVNGEAGESSINCSGGDSSDVERPAPSTPAASSSRDSGAEAQPQQQEYEPAPPPRDGTEEPGPDGEAANQSQIDAAVVDATPPSDATKSAKADSPEEKQTITNRDAEQGGDQGPPPAATDKKTGKKPSEDEGSTQENASDKTIGGSSNENHNTAPSSGETGGTLPKMMSGALPG